MPTAKTDTQEVKAGTLAEALVEAQKFMPGVKKSGSSHHGSYVTLDEIIEKTRYALNSQGISIMQMPGVAQGENGEAMPILSTVLLHVSGEQVSFDTPLFLQKKDMQSFGSAITYARRYAWAAALGIAVDNDDDGAAATKPAPAEDKAQKPARRTTTQDAFGPSKEDQALFDQFGAYVDALGLREDSSKATLEKVAFEFGLLDDTGAPDTSQLRNPHTIKGLIEDAKKLAAEKGIALPEVWS